MAQIVLPYRGAFVWKTGKREALVDMSQTLYVAPAEEFAEDYPTPGGMACIVITPAPDLWQTSAHIDPDRLASRPEFRHQTRVASLKLLFLAHALRHRASHQDALAIEEWLAMVLREAFSASCLRNTNSPAARQKVEHAKHLLNERFDERLSLGLIAGELGVSGGYLTQAFTAIEGVPLYRYQMRLRLARALSSLPDSDDLTQLALDLGFSSHSHFSTAFRQAFGLSPSAYRASWRKGNLIS